MKTTQFMFRLNPDSPLNNHTSHVNKLKDLFKSWNYLLEEYEKAWREVKNLPYVYNEQAEIGLLAIAARDTKGLPFLEFSIQKHGKEKDYSGRADLEIYWKKKLDWCIGIEAKPGNISCSSKRRDKNLVQTVKIPLEKAKECANRIKGAYHDRLALVIGKLIYASDDFDRKQFCKVLFNAAWHLNADFCAIHFCDEDIWKNSGFNDCPGVALVGKISGKRASKT